MSNIKRIIAKLDIKGPNLVKGINMEGLRVMGNPEYFSESYYKDSADEIIYHDCVASLYERQYLSNIIKNTAEKLFIPLCVGGGIKKINDIENILKFGADKVFLNSAVLKEKKILEESVKKFGSSTIAVGIEANLINNKFYCFYDYGREPTNKLVVDWCKEIQDLGAGEIVLTSIKNEGTGKSFDLSLIDEAYNKINVPLIINGGAGTMKHILEVLKIDKVSGVSLSSILHYSKIKDKDFKYEANKEGNTIFLNNSKANSNFEKINIKKIKKFLSKNKILVRQ